MQGKSRQIKSNGGKIEAKSSSPAPRQNLQGAALFHKEVDKGGAHGQALNKLADEPRGPEIHQVDGPLEIDPVSRVRGPAHALEGRPGMLAGVKQVRKIDRPQLGAGHRRDGHYVEKQRQKALPDLHLPTHDGQRRRTGVC